MSETEDIKKDITEEEKTQPGSPADVSDEEGNGKQETPDGRKPKRHLIKNTWARRVLKSLMWFIVAVVLLPFLLYIPPIQTLVKNIACSEVSKSTGMKIDIGTFRLRFPLDLELENVKVLDKSGDTMVVSRKVVLDVKLLPLFSLDVRIKKLRLEDSYYRMVSEDSSMVMTVRARELVTDDRCSANIAKGDINLDKVWLKGGRVNLYMDVWRQKPKPPEPGKFLIRARQLDLEDFRFSMSMLPTIDTLWVTSRRLVTRNGVIDLRNNLITLEEGSLKDGKAVYITPTAQYIASHPAPPPSPYKSPPITISASKLQLDNYTALYATKGARPVAGFDPAYMQFSDVSLQLEDFYNRETTVRLPISMLKGKERSGLDIAQASGTVGVDSTGVSLDELKVKTLYSQLSANAYLSFGMMAMQENGPFNVDASGTLGLPDIDAFMPAMKVYTSKVPGRKPLDLALKAGGKMGDILIDRLKLSMAGLLALDASGSVRNVLNPAKLAGRLTFDGKVHNPVALQAIGGMKPMQLPPLQLKGKATAAGDEYTADFVLTSPDGNVAGKGNVGLTSERYLADVTIHNLNVGKFFPETGVGIVDGHIYASGAGFNPTRRGAATEVKVDINRLDYGNALLTALNARATLHNGGYTISLISGNEIIDGIIEASGTVAPDDYYVDMTADLVNIDLQKLGMSKDVMRGSGVFTLRGSASPDKWLYDVDLAAKSLEVELSDYYIYLPNGIDAHFAAEAESVKAYIDAEKLKLDFNTSTSLQAFSKGMTSAMDVVMAQLKERKLDVSQFRPLMPEFDLTFNASGDGFMKQFFELAEMNVDSLYADISNHGELRGRAGVTRLAMPTMTLDTITLAIKEADSVLEYRAHLGNKPGNMDEFHSVNINGYVGENHASLNLRQRNLAGETGYRIGLTAALGDSLLQIHFTPLNSTIAYKKWTFNDDNYIEYDLNRRISARLEAHSNESSISVETRDAEGRENQELLVGIKNLKIEDFINMIPDAPPVAGSLDADLKVYYDNAGFTGGGTVGLQDLIYNKMRVGNFNLGLDASLDPKGNTQAAATMNINGHPVLTLKGIMRRDSTTVMPGDMVLTMNRLPLSIANPFLGADVASLGGTLSGDMELTGKLSKPMLNGKLRCDSVNVFLPIMGGRIWLDNDTVPVADNKVTFDDFRIWGANRNPLSLSGLADATNLTSPKIDLSLKGRDFMLINNDKRAKSTIYGKLLLNLDATAKGSLSLLDVNANMTVLRSTDIFYTLSPAQQDMQQGTSDMVKFVNLCDTVQVQKADSLPETSRMRIQAQLNISNGVQATVNLSDNGSNKVQLQPSGSLYFFQNFMGDMKLTGKLNLGSGFARYAIPVIGERSFDIDPSSYVNWTGVLLNPTLNLLATDNIKSAVQQSDNGRSRLVDFLISVSVSNNLEHPKVLFDLSTDDDITIQNELSSMSSDQRSMQAMNMLLYGRYTGPGAASGTNNLVSSSLYSFLESQLNSWMANNVRGVDLSFGIDQYNSGLNGSQTSTSYSYQVSKSLFDNRFKIVVGGNYNTDEHGDENFAQNLFNNISFEYMLRQTNSMSMYVKLFRHNDYESILEGEITEMGAGYVMQRKLNNLRQLFSWLKPKKRKNRNAGEKQTERNDTTAVATTTGDEMPDSTSRK